MNPQTIVLLDVTNFKRIGAFKAEFDPANPAGVVILAGDNEAGKSSVLDSILASVTGVLPKEPLKKGELKGRILMKTQDFVFEYRLTPNGNYFELRSPEGQKYSSPRTLLNKFYSSIGFDPLAFASMKEKDQTEELLRVCPVSIDLAENAKEAKRLYDERTFANREVKRIEAVLQSTAKPSASAVKTVSITDLTNKLEASRMEERAQFELRSELGKANELANRLHAEIENKKEEIADLEDQLKVARNELNSMTFTMAKTDNLIEELSVKIKGLPDLQPDIEAIKRQIAEAENINALAEEHKQQVNAHENAEAQLEDAQAIAQHIDDEYRSTVQARMDALREAEFPVTGLSIDEEGVVRLNDIPFSQCSTAQKIETGVELARAAAPSLRVIFVRDGSLLDADSMKTLRQTAEKHGLQVWVERVSDESPDAIKIVDGRKV
jgi:DNA repair exonuclease SbcCD ATPase subunit